MGRTAWVGSRAHAITHSKSARDRSIPSSTPKTDITASHRRTESYHMCTKAPPCPAVKRYRHPPRECTLALMSCKGNDDRLIQFSSSALWMSRSNFRMCLSMQDSAILVVHCFRPKAEVRELRTALHRPPRCSTGPASASSLRLRPIGRGRSLLARGANSEPLQACWPSGLPARGAASRSRADQTEDHRLLCCPHYRGDRLWVIPLGMLLA